MIQVVTRRRGAIFGADEQDDMDTEIWKKSPRLIPVKTAQALRALSQINVRIAFFDRFVG